jgi:hypothetical protein
MKLKDGRHYFRFGYIAFHTRSYYPGVICGILDIGVNGIQIVAGRFAVTINWPLKWKRKGKVGYVLG